MTRTRAAGILLLAVLLTPLVPTVHLPLGSARELYAGPDLFDEAPVTAAVISEEWPVPGLIRVRRVRTTQGGTLLREARERSLRVPLPVVAALLGLGLLGRGKGEDPAPRPDPSPGS